MPKSIADVSTIDDLRQFVRETICTQRELLLAACQFKESMLVRSGRPWGLHFSVGGPRAVKYTAIWDVTRGSILFYECNGGRFLRIDLTACTELEDELAELMTAA